MLNAFAGAARRAARLGLFALAIFGVQGAHAAGPTMSISDASLVEGDSGVHTMVFHVTLSSPAPTDVFFDRSTGGGNATANVDYMSAFGFGWGIPQGQTSIDLEIQVYGDAQTEGNETFQLTLSNVSGATLSDGVGVGTIVNDDGASNKPSLSIADVTTVEGDSGSKLALFTVQLDKLAPSAVSFDVQSANGSAISNLDYIFVPFQHQTIPAGSSSLTIPVTINGDVEVEANENFTISVLNVSGAYVTRDVATGTISNDDGVSGPSLSVNDVSIAEGNSGTKTATFTVTLSSPLGVAASFDIATADDTATAGSDYVAKSAVAQSIPAGQTSKTFTVTINGDSTFEADETFTVNLSNPVNTNLADRQGVGTITNDDQNPIPTISINDVSLVEGDSGIKQAVFTISLDHSWGNATSFTAQTQGGTVNAFDYDPTSQFGMTIPAGQTSTTFSVPIHGDTMPEPDETLNVIIGDVAGGALYGDGQGTATILNDDTTGPTVSIADVSISEGDSGTKTAMFTLTLSSAVTWDVFFDLNTVDGTAAANADYVPLNWQSQRIDAGSTTRLVAVTINGDTEQELNETFLVNLSNVAGAIVTDGSAVGTITNDDGGGTPAMGIGDVTITEGNSGTKTATFTVSLSSAAATDVFFDIATEDGTARSGSDFVAKALTGQKIAAGATSKTFTVTINGDSTSEPDEFFYVDLSNATGATISDAFAVGTISNDDAAGPPAISVADASIVEGNSGQSYLTFSILLTSVASSDVTFNFATSDGTASSSSDYFAQTGGGVLHAGNDQIDVMVPIIGDNLAEPDETLTLNLSSVVGATVARGTATGTIVNDDGGSSPTLSIGDVSVTEGNSGTKTATFTVSLSAAASSAVAFDVATANGTATSGSDYVALALVGQTIAAGQTSKSVSVTINGDTAVEADETFNVNVTNVSGATVSDGSAVGTIGNDDGGAGPTLSIADVTVSEGNSATKTATFTLQLSAAQSGPVLVDVATANGTATAGSDYVAKSTTGLRIAAGVTSKTFVVTINGDTAQEPDETFTVNLSNASGATIADGQAVGTISNDDSAGAPTLSVLDTSVIEGDSGTTMAVFTVQLSAPAATDVRFNASTSDGTATAGSDYLTQSWANLLMSPGTTTALLQIPVNGDTAVESDETFTINLTSATGATIADAQAVATITNDDSSSVTPSITIADTSINEGNSGQSTMTFMVTLSQATDHAVSFDYATQDGAAVSGSDFVATSGHLSIPAGQTSVAVTVQVIGDTAVEANETFTVALTNIVGATILGNHAFGSIFNDDVATVRDISIGDASIVEGNSGAKTMNFTISLSGPAEEPVAFDVATANGTATGGSDFVAINYPGQYINTGQSSTSVSVVINGDTDLEGDETFTVNLSNVGGANVVDGSAIGTITNDDTAGNSTLSVNNVTVAEGNSGTKLATFTVTLSAPQASVVKFTIATLDGSATAGSDYVAKTSTLQIAAGATSKTFSVTVNGDAETELDEVFTVNLSNPVGAVIGHGQGIGTITNDDAPTPSLTVADTNTTEGDSGTHTVAVTVMLSSPAVQPVTFDIATVDGNATAGADYVALSLTNQTIPAGQQFKSFDVTIIGDTTFEFWDDFGVHVSNVSGATVNDPDGYVAIVNDDSAPSMSIGDVSIVEGNAGTKTAVFTVSLSGPGTAPVSFDIGTADGTAVAGSDYVATTLFGQTIPVGQTSKTFSVTINGDTVPENDETFIVSLGNIANASMVDNQAVGTITNDDVASGPTISIGDVAIAEGNSGTKIATFTVTLSAPQSVPVLFDVATLDGTAFAGTDYVAKSLTGQRIAVGGTSKTFTVTINGDPTAEPDETFFVNLSNPSGAALGDGQAIGTITNDDGSGSPVLSIADASVVEGNSGTKTLMFTVSLPAPATSQVNFNVATSNGTAVAGSDYVAWNMGHSIAVGQISTNIPITINGDTAVEADEDFSVTLSGATGASIGDGVAVGTITNDDSAVGTPTLSIGDATVTEGNSLSKQATFTITLSAPSATAVTYSVATANGSAVAPADYASKSLSGQSIPAGATSKTFTVSVKGDTVVEPNETFTVNLSNVVGATLGDGQGVGTITNDDASALSVARFDAGDLVDDVDDGNRAPQLATKEYATLLLDTATRLCKRAPDATIVAVEGVEHRNLLGELAEAVAATCAHAPRYAAVMADGDTRGFLVDASLDVLGRPEMLPRAHATVLRFQGDTAPVQVVLAGAPTGRPDQRAMQAGALALYLVTERNEALVLLGASGVSGLDDLTLRTRTPLPSEHIFVSPMLLRAYEAAGVQFPVLPKSEAPAQLLKLQ